MHVKDQATTCATHFFASLAIQGVGNAQITHRLSNGLPEGLSKLDQLKHHKESILVNGAASPCMPSGT
jgi:hypothetical protein